jgi:hypothetical protein
MIGRLAGSGGGEPALDLERVVAPSATQTSAERFDLYRRGYHLRLLECLRAMHPALRHALGDELFDGFAHDYLAARPPGTYTLARLDEGFAAHLSDTRPDHDLPATAREPWPDFLVDVVRFERAFLEVYDGEGVEGRPIACSEDVPCGSGRPALGAPVVVDPVPCLRMLHSRYPVGEYVLAVRRDERPGLPVPRPTWLALVRRDFVVEVVPLGADSFIALTALLEGADSVHAAAAAGRSEETIRGWVASWADRGLFSRVRQLDHVPTSRRGVPCS